jgi:hypothetical protein
MIVRESGRGAEQAGMGVGDELHWNLRHPPFEAAFGDEAVGKA